MDNASSLKGKTKGLNMDSGSYRFRWGCFFLLLFFMASCTPNHTLKKPEGERDFLQEISHLEKLAREHSEASIRAQSHLQLALLYVDYRNPHLNYVRALQEMEGYLSLSPDKALSADLQSWLAVLRVTNRLSREKTEMAEQNRALQNYIERLQASLEKAQESNRNLRDEVAGLKEMNLKMREAIERLKTLDHQMEQKRRLAK